MLPKVPLEKRPVFETLSTIPVLKPLAVEVSRLSELDKTKNVLLAFSGVKAFAITKLHMFVPYYLKVLSHKFDPLIQTY